MQTEIRAPSINENPGVRLCESWEQNGQYLYLNKNRVLFFSSETRCLTS